MIYECIPGSCAWAEKKEPCTHCFSTFAQEPGNETRAYECIRLKCRSRDCMELDI